MGPFALLLAGNNYTNAVGTAGNNYPNAVGTAGNNYTNAVGAASNNYSNATFVKLIATNQTITGDLAITGNLTLLGNATSIISNNLIVGDSLIYLAANNYSGTDILDIGFVANYANGTGANVHTGLIRDATTKQYYLFQGLDIELQANNQTFVSGANGAVNATLNADLVAGNITLSGMNVYSWIVDAFNTANASNGWANAVGVSANSFATSIGASANGWANTKVSSVTGTAGQIFSSGGTTPTLNLITTAVTAATYGGATQVPVFTVDTFGRLTFAANVSISAMDYAYVNTAANNSNSYAALVAGYANTNASNGSYISTGVVGVAYGGTGNTTFLANSVLIGNGTNPVWGLTSSTEGHLLQISSAGAPQFAMLDGGNF